MKKSTYLLLFVLAVVVAGTLNFTFAAPLTKQIASPANTASGVGTQYALSFTTPTAGTIKSIEVLLPAGTFVNKADFMDIVVVNPADGVSITGTNIGTTTFTDNGGSAPTVIYTFSSAITTPVNADWYILLSKVANPIVTGNVGLTTSITTKDTGGVIIDGPTTSPFTVAQSYNPNSILNAINSKGGDICIGSGCPLN